jgi:DNA-binding CsgD family transcriptional regulator
LPRAGAGRGQSEFRRVRIMTTLTGTSDSALFLTDRHGKIVTSDARTARLLGLANDESILPCPASLPDWLAPILDEIRPRNRTKPDLAPRMERSNASGRFVFRAYPLHAVPRNGDAVIFAISIEHHAPIVATVDAATARSGLSERQRRVCTEMLQGASYAQIGRALDIKESTVVDHVRRIYEKLNVHSRDELRNKLL